MRSLQHQSLGKESDLSRELPAAGDTWRTILDAMLTQARNDARNTIPNVFRAGDPLSPEAGDLLFRGREHQVHQVERLLVGTENSSSIVLLGPRRCGKTSLLLMLPAKLPDAQCIFFDLQDNPVTSLDSFVRALHRRAAEQSIRARRVTIPDLPSGPAIEAAAEWLQKLEAAAGPHRVLICFDEFERLEGLFGGDRRELLQLMGLLRATIQHRRKVKLLVSGVAPFDELAPLWDDHFINAREIRIGHLDRDTARDLLTKPVPEFPSEAIRADVANAVFDRTGGQPYLTQLYGSKLVARLNDQERRSSQLDDVQAVEEQVLSEATPYFRFTTRSAPAEAQAILESLSQGHKPALTPAAQRWLERRCLITADGRLTIPVLGSWIREQVLVS